MLFFVLVLCSLLLFWSFLFCFVSLKLWFGGVCYCSLFLLLVRCHETNNKEFNSWCSFFVFPLAICSLFLFVLFVPCSLFLFMNLFFVFDDVLCSSPVFCIIVLVVCLLVLLLWFGGVCYCSLFLVLVRCSLFLFVVSIVVLVLFVFFVSDLVFVKKNQMKNREHEYGTKNKNTNT
jgi:hypothetical protein